MNQSSVCKVLLLSKLLDGFCPSFVEVCSRTVGESKSKVRSFSLLTIRVKVKVTWHTAKYGDPYSEFVLCIYPSKRTHTHTHTAWTHTHHEHTPRAVGSRLCCSARGTVGGSVTCSRAPQSWYWGWRERCTFTHPTYNPCRPETQTHNLSRSDSDS